MGWITKAAWLSLALVHVMPAAVLVLPRLTEQLYGVAAGGETGVLLIHRGALFLAVVAACLFAAFDPRARHVVTLVVAISVIGFLFVYARSGFPAGSLRTIALVDAVALIPLAWVIWAAWFSAPRGE